VDYQVAFNIAVMLAGALGGWILRSLTTSMENLQRDHKDMMNQFVRRDDYKAALERIELMLMRIWDRLDDKVDK
jgi:hypothetical protein